MYTTLSIIFFDNWDSIFRTFLVTILAYGALVVILRASGKRTLSKMNAFDFIVTIALGSTLASASLDKQTSLADAVLALGLFVSLQYAVTWLSVRFKWVKNVVTSKPSLLLYKGEIIKANMKKERITVEELYSAARAKGITDIGSIDAIVLESAGKMTVIHHMSDGGIESLSDVKGIDERFSDSQKSSS